MRKRIQRCETGAALIVTILLIAVISTLAMHVLFMSRLSLRTTRWRKNLLLVNTIAESAIEALAGVLMGDDDRVDYLQESWNLQGSRSIQDYTVSSLVTDENAKLNIRGLIRTNERVDERRLKQLERLLSATACDPGFSDALLDWMDHDETARVKGAESGYYQSLNQPYHSKNAIVDHLGELKFIRGGPRVLAQAGDYLTVYSDDTVNINTASALVVSCLSPRLSPTVVAAILAERAKAPFHDLTELRRVTSLTQEMIDEIAPSICFRTHFFSVSIEVHGALGSLQVQCILQRTLKTVKLLTWESQIRS